MRPLILLFLFLASPTPKGWCGEVETVDGRREQGDLRLETNSIVVHPLQGAPVEIPLGSVAKAVFKDNPGPSDHGYFEFNMVTNAAVALDQSTNDALNGITGWLVPEKANQQSLMAPQAKPGLTDAQSSTSPETDHGWFSGQVTWDLGTDLPPEERQLDSLSVWTGTDKARCDFSGEFAVSLDGKNFRTLPETSAYIDFGYLIYEKKRTQGEMGNFNHTEFRFPPGQVIGFRYLKMTVRRSNRTGQDSRFIEVDAFVSRAPRGQPQYEACLTLMNGSSLCGELRELNNFEVLMAIESGRAIRVPLARIARIQFHRLPDHLVAQLPKDDAGVVLMNQDLFEGRLTHLGPRSLRLSSVLFGYRDFQYPQEVLLLILGRPGPATGRYEITTSGGSRLQANRWEISGDTLRWQETLLGSLAIPMSSVQMLRPWPAP